MIDIPDSLRLRFRLLNPDDSHDADLLWQLDQDPEVMKYINGGHCTSRDTLEQIMLPRLKSYTNPEKGWGMWGVFEKASSDFIGWVLVRPMDYFSDAPQWHNLELGWRLSRAAWGQGIATEAAQAVVEALKAQQRDALVSFCAIADADNLGSIAIMNKLGMQYVKTYLHQDPLFNTEVVYYQCDL